jgi:hypothetical protein
MTFHVHYYNPWADVPTAGQITVSATEIQVVSKVPLVPARVMNPIIYFGALVWMIGGPLGMAYAQFFTDITITPVASPLLWGGLVCLLCVMLLPQLPLGRRRQTFFRHEIHTVAVQMRTVRLETATGPLIVAAKTSFDAQALATAIREGVTTPLSWPIRLGRESLADESGISYQQSTKNKPIPLTLAEGIVTLHGTRPPQWWQLVAALGIFIVSLAVAGVIGCLLHLDSSMTNLMLGVGGLGGFIGFIALLAHTKPEVRVLVRDALYEIATIGNYLTFLAPDAEKGERRYTLRRSSPQDATTLAQQLRNEEGASVHTTDQAANARYSAFCLSPRPLEAFTHPGQVQIDEETITFMGRSGLSHPLVDRVGMGLAAVIFIVAVPLIAQASLPLGLDEPARYVVIILGAVLAALLLGSLPATVILGQLLSGRINVPRDRVTVLGVWGSEVALTVGVTVVSIMTASPAEAGAMQEALGEQRGSV